uniref:Phospholipase A2 n=1 Tax=Steinernema glaseri TaxID=37863 RepID=A0A1I7ZHE4_9BILA
MKVTSALLFTIFLLTISLRHAMAKERFFVCGSTDFGQHLSLRVINKMCSHVFDDVNKCCATHDSCYGNQSGRDFCDSQFCSCLGALTATWTMENFLCYPPLKGFCKAVKWFGGKAYENSG